MGDVRPYDKVAPIHRVDKAYLQSAVDKNADPRLVERTEAINKDRARKKKLAQRAKDAADARALSLRKANDVDETGSDANQDEDDIHEELGNDIVEVSLGASATEAEVEPTTPTGETVADQTANE